MRVRFIGNRNLEEYHRPGPGELHFLKGEARDVPDGAAEGLLRDFPGTFVEDLEAPPIDKQIKTPLGRKSR